MNENDVLVTKELLAYSSRTFPFCSYYPCAVMMSKWVRKILKKDTVSADDYTRDEDSLFMGFLIDTKGRWIYNLFMDATNVPLSYLTGDELIDSFIDDIPAIVVESSIDNEDNLPIKKESIIKMIDTGCKAIIGLTDIAGDSKNGILPCYPIATDIDCSFINIVKNIGIGSSIGKHASKAIKEESLDIMDFFKFIESAREEADELINDTNDEEEDNTEDDECATLKDAFYRICDNNDIDPLKAIMCMNEIASDDTNVSIPSFIYEDVMKEYDMDTIIKIINTIDNEVYICRNIDDHIRVYSCKNADIVEMEINTISDVKNVLGKVNHTGVIFIGKGENKKARDFITIKSHSKDDTFKDSLRRFSNDIFEAINN